jgi:uncharacterized protein
VSVDLRQYVIFQCVIGSRAYGLDDARSDTDRRGIFLPPAELEWSLAGVPEQIEFDAEQEVFFEAKKFVSLALKANPNVLECLYSPMVEHATPLAEELLSMRELFLSKRVEQIYSKYVSSQFKKLQSDQKRGEVKWKHVMHLLRLQLAGITVLREGYVPVRVDEHRERLLAIKHGERSLEDCYEWQAQLQREFEAAAKTTLLPEEPNIAAANDWLIRARRSMI